MFYRRNRGRRHCTRAEPADTSNADHGCKIAGGRYAFDLHLITGLHIGRSAAMATHEYAIRIILNEEDIGRWIMVGNHSVYHHWNTRGGPCRRKTVNVDNAT